MPQCFGKYQNLPYCDECVFQDDCLGVHLGKLAERGLVVERFDPKIGQHVYSISEKGNQHLKERLKALGLVEVDGHGQVDGSAKLVVGAERLKVPDPASQGMSPMGRGLGSQRKTAPDLPVIKGEPDV